MRSTSAAFVSGLLLLGVAAGCSDDDEDASTSTTVAATDDTEAEGEEGDGEADLAGYCDASFDLNVAFSELDEEAGPEAVEALRPEVEATVAAAPAELAEPLAVLSEAFEAATQGDFEAFESDETSAADDTVHAFELENCDLGSFALTATDYAFEGEAPTTAGRYSIDLANEGAEGHVVVLGRLNDGVEGTAEDAFNAIAEAPDPEAAFGESFTEVSGPFAVPGDAEYGYAELEAGQYVLLCPIPVGSTPDVGFEGSGPPHFTQGMLQFFEIG